MGKALHKLAALLHNGEVGGKIRVKHIVKADLLQRRHHAAGAALLGREAEGLRPRHPHRRRHLDDCGDVRVRQRVQNGVGIVPGCQGAGGAVGHALPTECAVCVLQGTASGNIHRGAGAGTHHIPDVHSLNFIAHLNAAHTLDALAGLPNHGNVHVQPAPLRLHRIGLVVDVQVMGQILQLAVPAADAGGAGGIVLG